MGNYTLSVTHPSYQGSNTVPVTILSPDWKQDITMSSSTVNGSCGSDSNQPYESKPTTNLCIS